MIEMKSKSSAEVEVVERARRDLDAFGELVERYQQTIQHQCFSRVRDWHFAEDLAQETFVRAYLKLGQLKDPARFANWLRRIATNVCNEFMRRPARRELPVGALPEEAGTRVSDRAAEVPLDGLPEKSRRCVELFYNDGCSYAEIAEALDTSVAAVKGRVNRAKVVLRKEMAEMAPSPRSAFTQRVLDTLRQLQSLSGEERARAASKLHGALAQDKTAWIVSLLKHSNPMERGGAAKGSRKRRSPRVRDALVEMLLNDDWEENRMKAANALVAQRDPSVVPHLRVAAERSDNPREVVAAARSAIAQLEKLAPPTTDEPETLQFRADLESAAGTREERVELLRRLKAALADLEASVRSQAIKALQQLGDKRAAPAIAKLLDDPISGIRQAAAHALGKLGSKRATPALIRVLETSQDASLVENAVLALAAIGNRAALPHVLKAMRKTTRNEYSMPAMSMRFIENAATKDDLSAIREAFEKFAAEGSQGEKHWWRYNWGVVLAWLGDEEHVPELAAALKKRDDGAIIAGLARIGGPDALAALAERLSTHPSRLVAEALTTFGETGMQTLRDALTHHDSGVRGAASYAICCTTKPYKYLHLYSRHPRT